MQSLYPKHFMGFGLCIRKLQINVFIKLLKILFTQLLSHQIPDIRPHK